MASTTSQNSPGEAFSSYQLNRIGCVPKETLKTVQLRHGVTSIGRNLVCDVVTVSTFASREHCRISVTGDKVEVYDANVSDIILWIDYETAIHIMCSCIFQSFNGTFVNERRVVGTETLNVGDFVGIGCGLVDIPTLQSSGSYIVFQLKRTDVVEISDDEEVAHIDEPPVRSDEAAQSDDDSGDEERLNANMSQRFHTDMKQEQLELDLDDNLWNLEHISNSDDKPDEVPLEPIELDLEGSQSPSSMLYLQQLNTDRGGSPSLLDSSDLPNDVDEEFATNSPDDCCIVIDEHDTPTAADDILLKSWMGRLSQCSDSGYRAPLVKCEPVEDQRPPSIDPVAKRPHDDAVPSTSSAYIAPNEYPISHSLAKKMKRCTVNVDPLPACVAVGQPKRSAADDEPTTDVIVQEPSAPLPTVDAASRLLNFLKRRPSVCERSIQVIEAPPQPKRRKSICAGRNTKNASLERTKHSAKVDHLKESFKSTKPVSLTKPDRHKSDDVRKAKLRELAEANRKTNPEPVRIPVKPKVKMTHNSRGAFLADEVSLPPKVKRRPEPTHDIKKAKAPQKPQKSDCLQKDVDRSESTANQTKANVSKTTKPDSEISITTNDSASKVCLAVVEDTERTQSINAQHTKHRTQHSRSVSKPTAETPQRLTTDAEEQDFVDELGKYKVYVAAVPISVRSILRRCDSVRRRQRTLRFAENMCDYRNHIAFDTDVRLEVNIDPMHELIGDITGWNPDWLEQPSEVAEVNRADYVPKSMKHNYEDFASYLQCVYLSMYAISLFFPNRLCYIARTLVPLMKMELWQVIYKDYSQQRTDAPSKVTVSEHQHAVDRFKVQCESIIRLHIHFCIQFNLVNFTVVSHKTRLLKNHLVLVSFSEGKNTVKILALVTQSFPSRKCT